MWAQAGTVLRPSGWVRPEGRSRRPVRLTGWPCQVSHTGRTLEGSSSSSLATTQPASSMAPGRLTYFTRPLSCTFRVVVIFMTCFAQRSDFYLGGASRSGLGHPKLAILEHGPCHLQRMTPWAEFKCSGERRAAFTQSIMCQAQCWSYIFTICKASQGGRCSLYPFYRCGNCSLFPKEGLSLRSTAKSYDVG